MSPARQEETVAVIPAYEPTDRLPALVERLLQTVCARVILVDDGSSESCKSVFAHAERQAGCVVLRHPANQGKGAALKTAFDWVRREMPAMEIVLTADADGQHDPDDCRRVAAALAAGTAPFVLGVRTFTLGRTPLRSWWGNRWSTLAFAVRYGRWIGDTQTGLRAFRRTILPELLALPGEGYAYEMAVLTLAMRRRWPVAKVPVRTIYETGNASSHYHPWRDTGRVLRTLFFPPPCPDPKGGQA